MRANLESFFLCTPEEIKQVLQHDEPYLAAFCQKYKVVLVDFFPNPEENSLQGLMYVFTDDLGGYSIEGIKASLTYAEEAEGSKKCR